MALKRAVVVKFHSNSLLAAGVLGDGFGALADGVLGQFTWEKQTHCGLNLSACDGGSLVVVSQS